MSEQLHTRKFDLEMVGFCGFYETLLGDFLDEQLNYDLENLDDSLSKLKINEFNCWQNLDYKQYEIDTADMVMDKFLDFAKEMLCDIIDLKPTGKQATVSSPKFYNFTTDKIFKQVEIKEYEYHKLVGFLLGQEELTKKVLARHFTSYEGFTSFYSNKTDYWLRLNWNELTDLQFSYLVHCALAIRLWLDESWRLDDDGTKLDNINDVYDNFVRTVEKETYYDMPFGYSDYVNWGQYQRELRHALDREMVADTDDVCNDVLWVLVDNYTINDKNELVCSK